MVVCGVCVCIVLCDAMLCCADLRFLLFIFYLIFVVTLLCSCMFESDRERERERERDKSTNTTTHWPRKCFITILSISTMVYGFLSGVLVLGTVASPSLIHSGTPGGVPVETDCALRKLSYEFGKQQAPQKVDEGVIYAI